MTTQRIKELLAKSPTLPTLPTVVVEIEHMARDPQVGVREMGALVAKDPPLAARVLKIANSAYYGLRERCASTEQASCVLGAKVLRNVVMAAAVMKQFEYLRGRGIDLESLWKHSVLVGQAATLLGRASGAQLPLSPEELYTCGLLHDIGKLVLLDGLGDEYAAVLQRAAREGTPVEICEREALQVDHADVGSMLAVLWGLPTALAGAIQLHHGPAPALERSSVATLITHTNELVHRVEDGNPSGAAVAFDAKTLHFLAIDSVDVTRVVARIADCARSEAA
jgi:HD-like signal output (HDOD) protein